jgi:type IV pilus assembly protein PilE
MKRAFTLMEIVLVIGILTVLAVIAIPAYLRARVQSNESAAQASLRVIATAEVIYRGTNVAYATLVQLGAPATQGPPYIDAILAAGTRNGYSFTAITVTPEAFYATAIPVTANVTGVRSFCVTEDGVIRVQEAGGDISDRAACLDLPACQ